MMVSHPDSSQSHLAQLTMLNTRQWKHKQINLTHTKKFKHSEWTLWYEAKSGRPKSAQM